MSETPGNLYDRDNPKISQELLPIWSESKYLPCNYFSCIISELGTDTRQLKIWTGQHGQVLKVSISTVMYPWMQLRWHASCMWCPVPGRTVWVVEDLFACANSEDAGHSHVLPQLEATDIAIVRLFHLCRLAVCRRGLWNGTIWSDRGTDSYDLHEERSKKICACDLAENQWFSSYRAEKRVFSDGHCWENKAYWMWCDPN